MPESRDIPKLCVALVGDAEASSAWAEALSGRGTTVVRAGSVEEALETSAGLAIVFASPGDAPSAVQALAGHPDAPPVALLVGDDPARHPHTRLVKLVFEAKRDWESTFDALSDPLAVLGRDGIVARANRSLGRTVGRPIADVVKQHYGGLLGDPKPGMADPIAAALKDGAPRTQETEYSALPGVWLVTVALLQEEETTAPRLLALFKDITEFKQQQEHLLQAARLADVGSLAAGVAHEINTPLASIALRAESLLKSAQDPRLLEIDSFSNFPRYLKTIDDQIFRCKKIISALLDFSRSGKSEVGQTDLNVLCEKAGALVGHQMKIRRIEFSLRLEPGLPSLQADEGQLSQALIVLLMNAQDAASAGGHVELETRRMDRERVSVSISDDGVGIHEENLGKIFTPFVTTKRTGEGTGLGLAICKGIVTSHGGEIEVESRVDGGSRFTIVLPVAGVPIQKTPADGPTQP